MTKHKELKHAEDCSTNFGFAKHDVNRECDCKPTTKQREAQACDYHKEQGAFDKSCIHCVGLKNWKQAQYAIARKGQTDEYLVYQVAVSDRLNKQQAEFIVKACNSHAELLEACKDAVSYMNKYGLKGTHYDAMKKVFNQAITNAERG